MTTDGWDRPADSDWQHRLARARLDSLVSFHPDGVFALDPTGRFTAVNAKALLQSGGYTAAQLLGQSFVELLPEEDVPAVTRHFAGLLDRRPSTFEVRFRRGDGTLGELEIIGLPVVVDDEVVEIYGIAEDITDRTRFQLEIADARAEAEGADDAKSAFLATVSHEIRTPLTSLIAATELFGETVLSAQQQRLVTVMERSGDRLLRLVDEILDFSRIEAGCGDIVREPFCLAELVGQTVLELRGGVEDKGLELTCHVDRSLPRRLVGDPGRIAQVLTNLIDNAIKFTPSGAVDVHVSAGGGHLVAGRGDSGRLAVRFAVADTGIGLSETQQRSVFDMFHQADSSVTRRYGGTGLGLTVSRELVALMGGDLEVASSPGRGSTFAFVLPLSPE